MGPSCLLLPASSALGDYSARLFLRPPTTTTSSPLQTLPPHHHPLPPLLHRRLRHVRRPRRRHNQWVREPTHRRGNPNPLLRHHPRRTRHQRPHPHPPFIRPSARPGGDDGIPAPPENPGVHASA